MNALDNKKFLCNNNNRKLFNTNNKYMKQWNKKKF